MIKKSIILFFLFIGINFISFGQEQSEIAVINYIPYSKDVQISINGTDFRTYLAPEEQAKGKGNVNPGLIEVNKMAQDGWYLFDTNVTSVANTAIIIYTFILKRKKT